MVSLMSLWLPILLSAVIVFLASSVIHMFLGYHNTDYGKIPAEDDVLDAIRNSGVSPGDYVVPHAADAKARETPEYKEKMRAGPGALITVLPGGEPNMSKQLIQWFLFCLFVGILAGYTAGRALPPGADYLSVFRFAGSTAFVAYSVALLQNSIWFGRAWSWTLKSAFDGIIYGLLTAGVFGWLWPA